MENTRFGGFAQTVVKGSGVPWRAAREAMTLLEAVAAQLNYPSVHFRSSLFAAFFRPVGIFNLWRFQGLPTQAETSGD